MNKIKNKSIISTISLLLTLPFCLVSCNESGSEVNSDETIYLHVLNSEDYIDVYQYNTSLENKSQIQAKVKRLVR